MKITRALGVLGIGVAGLTGEPSLAQVVRQVTQAPSSGFRVPVLDDAGAHVYTASSSNQLGGNPANAFQLQRFVPATGSGAQVTSFPGGVSDGLIALSVSDDDQWLAFASRGDPAGLNNDRSDEIFAVATNGTAGSQLTSASGPPSGTM